MWVENVNFIYRILYISLFNMKKLYLKTIITLVITISLLNFSFTEKTLGATTACTNLSTNLKIGSKDSSENIDVSLLQYFLYSKGYMNINPTGYFGNITQQAVIDFQRSEGLPATGLVMTLTRGKISEISCKDIITNDAVTNIDIKNNNQTANVISTQINENTKVVIATPTSTPVLPTEMPTTTHQTVPPYSSSNFSDWTGTWGKVGTTTSGTLEIKADKNTTGAQAMLTNSNEWTNYKQDVKVLVKQGIISLFSRYIDDKNYLACTFSGKNIQIIQMLNGKSTVVASATLKEAPYTLYFYNEMTISMRVKNKTVGCGMIGSEDNITFTSIDDKLLKGGIGIQTWLNSPGVAGIELKNVNVITI
jgi:hypothetical protein